MSKRIYFRHWGNVKHLEIPAYAGRGVNSPIVDVAAAIGRKNTLLPIAISYQGFCPPDDCDHYQITFGTSCRTGGYNVAATLWVSIARKGD